ncbi:MAG: Formylglycine-generating enzyme, required for sulfatase activity, contains SUMF1/FGE domain [Verrucomicrobia bacterium]|nr:MAG: Formylglycine-generating enzyme, required for sulfatase activity, contains SUMF1/FGE domain [Verrucomicrobiota bacterium]
MKAKLACRFRFALLAGLCWIAGASAQEFGPLPKYTLAQVGTGPALLIGVGDYDGAGSVFGRLEGIGKDLEAIEATVRKLGWKEVTVLRDPTRDKMREAVDSFGARAKDSPGASFFYFSGHGVLQNRLNYMIPARAQVRTREHLADYAIPVEDVLGFLENEGSGPALVFIDACRNNDLPAGGKYGGANLLLSRRNGLFIGYATAEGEISNMTEKGSFFTRSLAHRLLTPGESLDNLYGGIIEDVEAQSKAMKAEAIQPPEKLSALRIILEMVPGGESPEMARLRAEVERLRKEQGSGQTVAMVKATPLDPTLLPNSNPQITTATAKAPFTNPLGMKFVPVPGTKILMSIWETRVRDFRAFRADTEGESDHPVVEVSWEDAQAFCQWLSRREGKTYRLPTDHEWSLAVGIGGWENATASPADKDGVIEGVYPWGTTWPPPNGAGNYDSSFNCDRFDGTAPVGSFAANPLGLFDLGGNVWEWCEDWYQSGQTLRVLRGGSWCNSTVISLRSSRRNRDAPTFRYDDIGFRVVLELGSGGKASSIWGFGLMPGGDTLCLARAPRSRVNWTPNPPSPAPEPAGEKTRSSRVAA